MSKLISGNNNSIKFKHSDIRLIDDLFINGGYVLDFSDRTFAEFFEDEIGVNIDIGYGRLGSSKGNRLRTFFQIEEPKRVLKILDSLFEYSELGDDETKLKKYNQLRDLISGDNIISTEGIDTFKYEKTLEELIKSINRDIDAGKPQIAISNLHTYCVKRFKHLLDKKSVEYTDNDPLHSLIGKYNKWLSENTELNNHPISFKIMKYNNEIWKEFNDVRNNRSTAHDNELLNVEEARFIFETMTSMLRFIKHIEKD